MNRSRLIRLFYVSKRLSFPSGELAGMLSLWRPPTVCPKNLEIFLNAYSDAENYIQEPWDLLACVNAEYENN
jgi:hypothetical protein